MADLQLEPRTASEAVGEYAYRMLRKNIVYVRLKPGDALSESSMAAALSTSRTPIRETFSRLMGEGLLDVYPQRGTYVSRIDMKRVEESSFMRTAMDQAIAPVACERFSDENLFALESNLNRQIFCRQQQKDEEVFELDNRMHELIYTACGMEHVWQAVRSISADQYRIRFLKLAEGLRWEETIEEHRQIVAAIRHKDAARLQKLLRAHVMFITDDARTLAKSHPDYFVL